MAALNKISNIQGIRGIAFLMIFFAHSWGIYIQQNYAIEALGAMGVQIFFAISGYLIACRHGDKVFGNVYRDGIS